MNGLMNDKDKKVRLLIDREMLESEYKGCHPCVNTASLKIKTSIERKKERETGKWYGV